MANTRISDLATTTANLAAADLAPVVQTAGVGPVAMTGQQIADGVAALHAALVQNTDSRTLSGNLTFSANATFTGANAVFTGTQVSGAANLSFTGANVNFGGANTRVVGTTLYSTANLVAAGLSTLTGNVTFSGHGFWGAVAASNLIANSTAWVLASNAATTNSQVSANTTALFVGNSTVNTTVNGSAISVSGSYTNAANGHLAVHSGFKVNWGQCNCNATACSVTFESAFTTNAWAVSATGNTGAGDLGVYALTKSGFTMIGNTTANQMVYWIAIGQ